MANSYIAPHFNIDTNTNVAGLTVLKGAAPALTDEIWVYNGATLTIEQNLSILQVNLGRTSAGAAPGGQRYGHFVQNAGTKITWAGAASANNSGIQCNPASPDSSSRQSTIAINGTSGSHAQMVNDGEAQDTNKRWRIYLLYGSIDGEYLDADYYYNVFLRSRASPSFTNASRMRLDHVTIRSGTSSTLINPSANPTIPEQYRFWDVSGISGASWVAYTAGGFRNLDLLDLSGWRVLGGSNGQAWQTRPGLNTTTPVYSGSQRLHENVDIRPTEVIPAGLSATDPASDGDLDIAWTNSASYSAGDLLYVHNAVGDAVLGILDATAGLGRICGLVNGATLTMYARATSDNFIFSAASATFIGTPTAAGIVPPIGNDETGDFQVILAEIGESVTWRRVLAQSFNAANGTMTDTPNDVTVLAVVFGPNTKETQSVPEADLAINVMLTAAVTMQDRFLIDSNEYEVIMVRTNSRIAGADNIERVFLKKRMP